MCASAKAWAQALAQLRNRGLEETLFVCCDGLTGLGEEITATWPQTTVQTCVVHYPDTVVMPIPGGPALAGGGERVLGIGIIERAAA